MIGARIGPDLRMVVVASPSYLSGRERPKTPHDLTQHRCINIRMPSRGGLYAWELEKDGRVVNVRVDGPLIVTDTQMATNAAAEGLGLAYLMEDHVGALIKAGRLIRLLEDWSPPFSGYHLYYPDRHQLLPAFKLFVEALRYRGSM